MMINCPYLGAGRLFYIRGLSDKIKQMKRVSVDHRWALLPSCLPEFSSEGNLHYLRRMAGVDFGVDVGLEQIIF